MTSRSPSPRRTSHSRSGKIRPQEDTSSSQHPPKDPSSSQINISLPSSHSEATYPQLRKKPSITMPGSLFPRSDSLQPEPHDEEMESRRVRFLSASEDTYTHERNSNPVPRTPQSTFDIDAEPGPSNSPHVTPEDQTGPSPWRTRPIASVHDAVQRFTASGGEERDFSLLVVASPMDPADAESPGATPPPGGVSRKGKERAVDDGDEDLAFILDHHRVQDKEKQLDAVRRETGAKSKTTGDEERDRDKERIRILEEEVRMLKEEVRCVTSLISFYSSFWYGYVLICSIAALPPPPFATSSDTGPNTTPTPTTPTSSRRSHPPPSSSRRKQGPFRKCARCLTPNRGQYCRKHK